MRERITIEDAQPLIGLPIRTVQAMAAKGEIPGAAKMRRRWTFDRVKLEGWIVHKEQETWQNAQRRRPGCYWRGSTLWAKAMVGGRMSWWSLDTSDPAIAKKRREAGKARLLADAKHGDAKRSLEEAIVAWEGNLTRQVANGVLGQKTKTRYLVSIKQLAPYLDGKALSDIDLRLLTGIVEAREQKGVTNATIKRDLVALSSLMNFALDKGWVEQPTRS